MLRDVPAAARRCLERVCCVEGVASTAVRTTDWSCEEAREVRNVGGRGRSAPRAALMQCVYMYACRMAKACREESASSSTGRVMEEEREEGGEAGGRHGSLVQCAARTTACRGKITCGASTALGLDLETGSLISSACVG
jgi:hypothetical protein